MAQPSPPGSLEDITVPWLNEALEPLLTAHGSTVTGCGVENRLAIPAVVLACMDLSKSNIESPRLNFRLGYSQRCSVIPSMSRHR